MGLVSENREINLWLVSVSRNMLCGQPTTKYFLRKTVTVLLGGRIAAEGGVSDLIALARRARHNVCDCQQFPLRNALSSPDSGSLRMSGHHHVKEEFYLWVARLCD